MRIRKMVMDDYEAVSDLWRQTSGLGMNDQDDSRDGIIKYLDRNPDTCFVAEEENSKRIIGTILSGHDGRRGFIYHAAVEQDLHKQGIGTLLVKTALVALKEKGIHKVALVAFRSNKKGNSFWKACGFEAREDLIYRNKSRHDENE